MSQQNNIFTLSDTSKKPFMTPINERFSMLDNGGGPPHDGGMEARITKLEDFVTDARDRLTHIETRLDQTATKSDLTSETASMIKWMVATAVVLGATAITVMTFVLNNAIPKAAVAASSPIPIIIQMPQQPPPSPTK